MMYGYFGIILASIIWSLVPALISRVKEFVRPFTFTSFRAVFATLVLLPMFLLSNNQRGGLDLYVLFLVVVSGLLGPGLGDTYYAKAIQSMGASLAVILSYTYIFIAQLMSSMILGESLDISLVSGTLLAFMGIIIALSSHDFLNKLNIRGVLYSFIAALSWSSGAVVIKLTLNYVELLTLTIYRLVSCSLVFITLGLILERPLDREVIRRTVVVSAITGILGFGVGAYLFAFSINSLGVSATAMATALTPTLSQVTVKLFSKEKPTSKAIVGALLTSFGIMVSTI
ncbi:MAG: DMT family transporter [Sulfolobales archaeon]